MRDWRSYVQKRLGETGIALPVEDHVVDELASMLVSLESELVQQGECERDAEATAEAQIPDWKRLAHEIRDASVQEELLSPRVQRVFRKHVALRRNNMFVGIGQDLARAVRSFFQHPSFSFVAVATLALGIGANAALFTVVDTVVLSPLPYERADELVRLRSSHADLPAGITGVSTGDVKDWRRGNLVLEGIGGWYVMGRTLRLDQRSEVVTVAQVSEDFFSVFRTQPVIGRTFTAEETARALFNTAASHIGTDPVIVVSHHAWQSRFGGDPSILERTIEMERQSWRVVGVMPADFSMPSDNVDLWIPWSFEGDKPHDQRYLDAVARLKPGVGIGEAEQQLNAVAAELGARYPESNAGWGVRLTPLREDIVGDSRRALLVLLAAIGLVLLIACVNVAGLQLVRIGEQHKEIALRTALGATRTRLVRHFFFQSLAVSVAGGLASLPAAVGALYVLTLWSPEAIPRLHELGVDGRLLLVSAVLTLAAGLLFGLIPALAVRAQGGRSGFHASIGRSATSSPGWQRFRRALVVGELAVAVVLLVAAGLLLRSYYRLSAVNPGFQREQVVVLPITLDNHEYDSGAKTRAYYRQLTETLSAVPGVVSVGGVTALPMSPIGPDFDRPVWAEGEIPSSGGARRADIRMATPGYFETLRIPIRQGRGFSVEDGPESRKVVMVSEGLASQVWPNEDAVGKQLVIDYSTAGTYPFEVVGVVSDIRFHGLRATPRPELYLPHAQRSYLIMNMAVRAERDARALAADLHRAVLSVDPAQPAQGAYALSELVAGSIRRDRLAMLLMGSFAAVAMVLSMLGLFGTVSYYVAQRSHEFGVRAALGASRGVIARMMLSVGLRMALVGGVTGLALALLTGRLLGSLLYEVSPLDITVLVAVAATLVACVLAACLLPARRASRVDPVIALRHD